MVGLAEELLGGGGLDDPAQIHDHDAVGDVLDHREVVADEEVGQAQLVAQLHEEVQHLRLDRDVEGGDGLVAGRTNGYGRGESGSGTLKRASRGLGASVTRLTIGAPSGTRTL